MRGAKAGCELRGQEGSFSWVVLTRLFLFSSRAGRGLLPLCISVLAYTAEPRAMFLLLHVFQW